MPRITVRDGEHAVFVGLLRLPPDNNHHFASDVESLKVVVRRVIRLDPIATAHDPCIEPARLPERARPEKTERVRTRELGARRDFKLLKRIATGTCHLQAGVGKRVAYVLSRLLKALGADATPLELIGG